VYWRPIRRAYRGRRLSREPSVHAKSREDLVFGSENSETMGTDRRFEVFFLSPTDRYPDIAPLFFASFCAAGPFIVDPFWSFSRPKPTLVYPTTFLCPGTSFGVCSSSNRERDLSRLLRSASHPMDTFPAYNGSPTPS